MNLTKSLQRFSRWVSLLALLLGSIVMVGWMFNIPELKSVVPGLVSMKVNTASGFLLSGLSLTLWHVHTGHFLVSPAIDLSFRSRFQRQLSQFSIGLAILVAVLGLLTLIQYGFHLNLGIDQLLLSEDYNPVQTTAPGRMAPHTALNFLLIGSALTLLHQQIYTVAQFVGLGSCCIGLLGLLGYLYQIKFLYSTGFHTAMALHTSVGFVLLTLGIIFAVPHRGWLQILVSSYAGGFLFRRLLPAVIVIPLLLGCISLILFRKMPDWVEVVLVLRSLFNMVIMGCLLGWQAQYLNVLDWQQQQTEQQLRQSQIKLEDRVRERTAELTESRRQLSNLINTLPGIVFVRNPKTTYSVQYLSDGCLPLTGYSFEDLTSCEAKTYNDLIHTEDLPKLFNTIRQGLRQQKRYGIEYRIVTKSNQEKWFWEQGNGVWDESGEMISIEGFITDITALKLAEAQLRASENRLRALIDAEPECVKLVNIEGNLLEINAAGAEILEVDSIPSLIGQSIYSFIVPEYQDAYQQFHQQVCSGQAGVMEYELITCKGKRRWMETHAVPWVQHSDQKIVHLAVTREITERKQAEQERQAYLAQLKAWQNRYETAALVSGQILYEYDLQTGQHTWGPNIESILGYSQASMPIFCEDLLNFVHPDDQDSVRVLMEQAITQQSPFRAEYRIRHQRGDYRWIEDRSQFVFQEQNHQGKIIGFLSDISDRKQAEQALRDSEAKFRQLADNIQEVFFINGGDLTQMLYISPAYETVWGRSCESVYEQSQSWVDSVHPEDLERVMRGCEGMLQGREFKEEYRIIRPDGSIRWIRARTVPVLDEQGKPMSHPGIAEDITDYKEADLARCHSEERYRSLVEATAQVIWTTGATGEMLTEQPSWSAYTGQSFEDYAGWGWANGIHPGDRERTAQVWSQAVANRSFYENEVRLRGKDGTYRYFWVRSVPVLEKEGQIREWVGACTDITERKQAELAIRQLNEELEQRVKQRTAELQATNKELEAFCYSVSHDLRAPLRNIDGFSQVLLDRYQTVLDDKGKHYVTRIRAGVQRMGELIEDLLALSRVTRTELQWAEVNLTTIVETIVDNLTAAQPERQVQCKIASEVLAYGDQRLLTVALENLLGNAWKFTSQQRQACIEFNQSFDPETGQQIYWVKDNGTGFDMNYADKLFGVFQRLHSADVFPGTGIGLATVQRIIHRHGGQVWAVSAPDTGATFYFSL